ncbi:N-6 DNA methylase [Streptacidiphilus melanogenes]|uniref:N-6 DNA methylase n=1 Tax=Streptacidiphilus melanogenes TaxID=411235 RepID=UPI0006948AD9|nr:N-6 DNA methylase [Streptacidiphilus melanogenes]
MTASRGFEQSLWSAVDRVRGSLDLQSAQQFLLCALFLRCLAGSPGNPSPGGLAWREVLASASHRGEAGPALVAALDHAWTASNGHAGWMPSQSIQLTPAAEPFLREVLWLVDGVADPRQVFDDCLEGFSSSKTGGNYFTPRHLVRLMVALVEPQHGDRVLDPACGSGGFLAEAARYAREHQGPDAAVRPTGRDVNTLARQTAWMNLTLHGLEADLGTRPVDSLRADDTPAADFDVVLTNPPFNLKMFDDELRWPDPRWRYGVPPRSNANFAWVQHVVSKLAEHGRGAMLLPDGAAFAGGESRSIREGLVRDGVLAAVVALPPGLVAHTSIRTSIWLFTRERPSARGQDVLLVNAWDLGGTARPGRRSVSAEDVERITGTYRSWRGGTYQDKPGWCRSVSFDELAARDFDLQPIAYTGAPATQDDAAPASQRVTELTGQLYELFDEAARLEAELRFRLGDA